MIILSHDPKYSFEGRDNQPTDAIVVREIFCENVYEVLDGDLFDTHTVVDLGANIGAFSVYAASLHEDAKVYAYEPEPTNYDLLEVNIRRNGMEKKITPVRKAVADYNGSAHITNNGGDSKLAETGSRCDVVSLEQLWKDHNLEFIDVLKIDVEGAEGRILLTTPHRLMNLIRYIVLEFDKSADDLGDIVEYLSETHQVKVVGKASQGAQIFARRY